ncbi:MAG: PD40 domain-containing protein [Sandaracinaceae bacterium]|jgi:hypothetical protein|nr:PD40 domain-containing protein [Sandaracinaceae bacterium]
MTDWTRVLVLSLLFPTWVACAAEQQSPPHDASIESDAAAAMDASSELDLGALDGGWVDGHSLDLDVSDGGAVDAGPGDGGVFRCDWSAGPVITGVVALNPLNTDFNETEPFVTADGLTIYFSSSRTGSGDVYTATRASTSAPFGAPTLVPWASGANWETRVELTADGLTAYKAQDASGGRTMSDLWVAQRASPGESFALFQPLMISTASNDVDPHLTADGLHLYFANNGGTGGRFQILASERASSTESFLTSSVVTALADTASENANATLNADETVVVFTSTRLLNVGSTDANIWYSTRASRADAFSAPLPLPATVNNVDVTDYEPFITQDGCEIYFTSTRNAPDDDDLFVALVAR